MNVIVEDISEIKKRLIVEVEPEVVSRELAKAIVKITKTAKIPGFRPGKAPRSAVERHYGEDVKAEALQQLIAEAVEKAVAEKDLVPVTMPEIGDVSELDQDKPLTITATVDVRPEIELGTYFGIAVKDVPVSVPEQEVEDAMVRLQEVRARAGEVDDEPLASGHMAVIDFKGYQDGKPLKNTTASDYRLIIGTNTLVPGFEDQLVGMRKGETREVRITFPANYQAPDLAGADATFTVRLKAINRKVIPELNDEFAREVGAGSLDELRTRMRQDLEARKLQDRTAAQKDQLLATLIDAHAFAVPEALVEQELAFMANQHVGFLRSQGADPGAGFDVEDFKRTNREMAVKRVKGIVILQEIAIRENITVSDNDVSAAMANMARSTGQKLEQIFKYYEQQEGGLDNLRESLLAQKTLDFLLSKATVA